MGCGCLTLPTALIIIAFIVILFVATSLNSCEDFSGGSASITKSTIEREPLPKGSVVETSYYTDNLGWIGNRTALTAGMKNFYQKTGVQPYLYLTDNINGSQNPQPDEVEAFAFSLYDSLFKDEAHLLLIFFEPDPNYYQTWYVAGRQAKSVIDDEAADILLDYIDRYYDEDYTDEEYFSKAFNDAGVRIMHVPKSPWPPVLITLLGLSMVIVGLYWWRKAKEQKNREAEDTERILSKPLDTFGDQDTDDLAQKYRDEPDQTIIDITDDKKD